MDNAQTKSKWNEGMKRTLQDILKDREITELDPQELLGIHYKCWSVKPPLFGDQVETLLENGYMVSMQKNGEINIDIELTPSPEQLRENKRFWNDLTEALEP